MIFLIIYLIAGVVLAGLIAWSMNTEEGKAYTDNMRATPNAFTYFVAIILWPIFLISNIIAFIVEYNRI